MQITSLYNNNTFNGRVPIHNISNKNLIYNFVFSLINDETSKIIGGISFKPKGKDYFIRLYEHAFDIDFVKNDEKILTLNAKDKKEYRDYLNKIKSGEIKP